MERVDKGAHWSLMDPDECPGLPEAYGDDFRVLYERYETEGRFRKQVSAQEIFNKIIEAQIETGTPYIGYKDAVNRKSNQKNLGTIMNSNLCVAPETLILTKDGYKQIKTLSDQEVEVWNGENWSKSLVKKTGENQSIYHITVRDKEIIQTIDTTFYHKFYRYNRDNLVEEVPAFELKPGDRLETTESMPLNLSQNIWIVESVENLGRISETYCFNEPIRHKGVLNGILTGNCHEICEYLSQKIMYMILKN